MASTLELKGNGNIKSATVTNLGAALMKLQVKDKDGKERDVVLGFDNASDYLNNPAFFGVVVGPVANRTANAKFDLNGTIYDMEVNEGVNNLHTSFDGGMHKKEMEIEEQSESSVTFKYVVKDMEDGFPGNRTIRIRYDVDGDIFRLTYTLDTDKDTVYNPTNHSYFNLNGNETGKIFGHEVKLYSDAYTAIDAGLIPTGEFVDLKGTDYDYSSAKVFDASSAPVDHNFRLTKGDKFGLCAEVYSKDSGIKMSVSSDLPGIQMYTGEHIPTIKGKNGVTYDSFNGIALETQCYPNSVNEGIKNAAFKRPVIKAGEAFKSVTEYKFEI